MLRRLFLAVVVALGLASAAQAGCTTSSTALTFQASSSYDVRATAVPNASGSAGLACTGAALSLLGGSVAKAKVTSANGFVLSAGGSDTIAYQVSADAGGTQVYTQGGTIDYMNPTLLSLLGIGSANGFVAPMFAKILASPNVREGTYTDTLTVKWDYAICNGLQVTFICLGYEADSKTVTVSVSLVVSKDCRISAPDVSFGSAPLAGQFTTVTQAVLVDCTKNATYKVSFSSGASPSARPWRTMSDGAGHILQYNIYRTDGTTIWDETNPQASAVAGTGSATPSQVQTYVAKVNGAQTTPPAGTYKDNVSVVITY